LSDTSKVPAVRISSPLLMFPFPYYSNPTTESPPTHPKYKIPKARDIFTDVSGSPCLWLENLFLWEIETTGNSHVWGDFSVFEALGRCGLGACGGCSRQSFEYGLCINSVLWWQAQWQAQ